MIMISRIIILKKIKATSEGSGRVIVCFNGMPHLHLPMLVMC